MNYHDEEPVTLETFEANRRHDAEWHSITMDPMARLRCRNIQTVVLGPLTDKKIARYEKAGYYTEAFRDARREIWQRRAAKRVRRDGNFLVFTDGHKVFSPL